MGRKAGSGKQASEKQPKAKQNGRHRAKKTDIVANGHNATTDDEANRRALFAQHLKRYVAYKKDEAELKKRRKSIVDLAKAECGRGIMRRLEFAIELSTPEGEAAARAEILSLIEVARWQGAPFGTQMSFIEGPGSDYDAAYEAGRIDSANGATARADYAPGSDMEQRYLRGYHDETERRVSAGIKPVEVEPAPSVAAGDFSPEWQGDEI